MRERVMRSGEDGVSPKVEGAPQQERPQKEGSCRRHVCSPGGTSICALQGSGHPYRPSSNCLPPHRRPGQPRVPLLRDRLRVRAPGSESHHTQVLLRLVTERASPTSRASLCGPSPRRRGLSPGPGKIRGAWGPSVWPENRHPCRRPRPRAETRAGSGTRGGAAARGEPSTGLPNKVTVTGHRAQDAPGSQEQSGGNSPRAGTQAKRRGGQTSCGRQGEGSKLSPLGGHRDRRTRGSVWGNRSTRVAGAGADLGQECGSTRVSGPGESRGPRSGTWAALSSRVGGVAAQPGTVRGDREGTFSRARVAGTRP